MSELGNAKQKPTKICASCGEKVIKSNRYVTYRLKVNKDTLFYCNRECAHQGLKTNVEQECSVCKKKFYCSISQLKLRNRQTCSMECRGDSKQSKQLGGIKKRTGLKHKAQILCNKVARLRDCGGPDGSAQCISCGIEYPFSMMDGGHFIPVTSGATRYDDRNINAQCRKCNRYLRGNVRHYYKSMLLKYGETAVDELEALEFVIKKWTVDELETIINDCKEQIKSYS